MRVTFKRNKIKDAAQEMANIFAQEMDTFRQEIVTQLMQPHKIGGFEVSKGASKEVAEKISAQIIGNMMQNGENKRLNLINRNMEMTGHIMQICAVCEEDFVMLDSSDVILLYPALTKQTKEEEKDDSN